MPCGAQPARSAGSRRVAGSTRTTTTGEPRSSCPRPAGTRSESSRSLMFGREHRVALLVHERAPARHGVSLELLLQTRAERDHGYHHRRRQPGARDPAAPASSRRRVMPSRPSAACSMTSRRRLGRPGRGRSSTFVSWGTSQRPASTSAQASKASAAPRQDPAAACSGRGRTRRRTRAPRRDQQQHSHDR